MPDATIHVAGKILERLREILYRVELPNGKVITGHLSKPLADANADFEDGETVVLELTAYDFDAGRILGRMEQDPKQNASGTASGGTPSPL